MEIKNSKAFTLAEFIIVMIIIGVLALIAIPSVSNLIANGKDKYNKALEQELVVMAKDYLAQNRNELPRGQAGEEGPIYTTTVKLVDDLEKNNFVTNPVVDADDGTCEESFVFVDNQDGVYVYQPCLKCKNYKTNNDYCNSTPEEIGTGGNPSCKIEPKNYTLNAWTNKNVEVTITNTSNEPMAFFRVKEQKLYATNNKATYIIKERGPFSADIYNKRLNKDSCSLGDGNIINIDKDSPLCSTTVSEIIDNVKREITVVGDDVLSGATKIEPQETNLTAGTVTPDGNKITAMYTARRNGTYTFTVTDKAGNEQKCTAKIEGLDIEAPVLTLTKANSGNGRVRVSVVITDNIEVVGWKKSATPNSNAENVNYTNVTPNPRFTTSFEVTLEGRYYVWGTDLAGNEASKYIDITKSDLDITPPSLAGSGINITTNNELQLTNNGGYLNVKGGNTVTVTLTFNEDLSVKPTVQIGGQAANVTGSGKTWTATINTSNIADGNQAVIISGYKDLAGNTGATINTSSTPDRNGKRGVSVDKVAPTCTVTSSGSTVSASASDSGSGIRAYIVNTNSAQYTAAQIGTSTVNSVGATNGASYYCHAADNAGNVANIARGAYVCRPSDWNQTPCSGANCLTQQRYRIRSTRTPSYMCVADQYVGPAIRSYVCGEYSHWVDGLSGGWQTCNSGTCTYPCGHNYGYCCWSRTVLTCSGVGNGYCNSLEVRGEGCYNNAGNTGASCPGGYDLSGGICYSGWSGWTTSYCNSSSTCQTTTFYSVNNCGF